ncbi:MAG: sulfatase-like hydrolase/transferase [Planctomycetes bacterium]|nr:sulfatase-like hydrolase/transferase [Planctomycetota bacterium]
MMRVIVLAAALVVCAGSVARAEAKKLNVLLIMSDDLSCRLGSYGGEFKSPQIDKLAARGVLFEHAYCQYPLCNPSRASFMAGQRPDTTRIITNGPNLRELHPDCVTMAQLFKESGYFSARVGKIYHYGVPREIGTNGAGDDPQSWNVRINPAGKDIEDENEIINYMPGAKPPKKGERADNLGAALSWRADDGADTLQTDGKVADETIKLLREHKDGPFFIACGFYRPHVPDVIPKGYLDNYPMDSVKLPVEPEEHLKKIPPAAFFRRETFTKIDADKLRTFKRAYMSAVSFMDAQLGRVIEAVDELGLADSTVIVFVSDHGWMLGEHGSEWEKQQLFEMSAKVPMIIVAPGMKGNGSKSGRAVELLDVYPTVADLCGLKAPAAIEGVSLRPLLADPAAAWDHPAYTQVRHGKNDGRSVRTERYRYTEWGDDGDKGAELYDYEMDPNEWNNLADDPGSKELREKMKALLHK